MGYRVTAPLVIFTRDTPSDTESAQVYVYENGVVPEWVSKEKFAELTEMGVVASDADAEKRIAQVGLAADTGGPQGIGAPGSKPGSSAPSAEDDDEPAKNASLADWQEYARSKGATDADLEDAKRDELVDKYGTKQ